jgi:endonuclease YncB( thermonuclease family)
LHENYTKTAKNWRSCIRLNRNEKLLLLFTLAFALAACAPAQILSASERQREDSIESLKNERRIVGKMVGVADGDTVTVPGDNQQQYKIRLDGVDAPESKQDFGQS